MRAWAFGLAGVLTVSTATVVVNPGGAVTNAVNSVQQIVTHTGGTTGGTVGGGSVSIGACHPH